MPRSSPAATAAKQPDRQVEIWIRQARSRRQAFYRERPTSEGTTGWHSLHVDRADKALRTGQLVIRRGHVASVVPRETGSEVAP